MKNKLLFCAMCCVIGMSSAPLGARADEDPVQRAMAYNTQYLERMHEEVGLTERQFAAARQIFFACIQTLESDRLEHRRRLFRALSSGAVTDYDDLGLLRIYSDGQLITRRFGVILLSLFESEEQRAKMRAFLGNNGFRYAIGWYTHHGSVSLPDPDAAPVPLRARRPLPPREIDTRNADYEAMMREHVNLDEEQFSAIRDLLQEFRIARWAAEIAKHEAAVGRLMLASADEFFEQHQWFCMDPAVLHNTLTIPYAKRLIDHCPDEGSKERMRAFLVEHGIFIAAGALTRRMGLDLSDLAE